MYKKTPVKIIKRAALSLQRELSSEKEPGGTRHNKEINYLTSEREWKRKMRSESSPSTYPFIAVEGQRRQEEEESRVKF